MNLAFRRVQFPTFQSVMRSKKWPSSLFKRDDHHREVPTSLGRDEFFQYTRKRFVRDEAYELAQRVVQFDIDHLASVAAEAVGSHTCVQAEKLVDGMFNKALLLTMDDGLQVVAKVPNPNAGRPFFTTASEVATMDYMRTVLQIPLPKVYAWNSDAANPVKAEYIIMEKIVGVPLDSVWSSMDMLQRWEVTKTIAQFQVACFAAQLPGYGSLYYADDLHGHSSLAVDGLEGRYAIGPTSGRDWSDDHRLEIDFDRGPWPDEVSYLQAVANREMRCVQELQTLPKSPITLCGPGLYLPTKERKLTSLQYYLRLLPFLIPLDRELSRPCMWHGDLHGENIFVNPARPEEVTGIIDWQATEAAPRFIQARQPHYMDYDGPEVVGLDRPQHPDGIEKLPLQAQQEADALFRDQNLVALYRTFLSRRSPTLYKCLEFQMTRAFTLLLLVRSLLVDGESHYMWCVTELSEQWREHMLDRGDPRHVECPVRFTEAEKSKIIQSAEDATEGMQAMNGIQEAMGNLYPKLGLVEPENYDVVKDMLRQAKEQLMEEYARDDDERAAWRDSWPFDD